MAISLKMHRTAVNRCPSRKLHPFRTVWLLLFGAAAVVQPQPLPHRSPTKPGPLPATLVIAPDGITTSGVSSGGAFAIQLHLAYSLQVQGAGIFAGPPYWCAQGNLATALSACEKEADLIDISVLVAEAEFAVATGTIDKLTNLKSSRVWLLSGTKDTVVHQAVVDKTYQFYEKLVPKDQIQYINTLESEHSWVTGNYGNNCSVLDTPFINNCAYDAPRSMLEHIYNATMKAAVPAAADGLIEFDQTLYTPLHTPDLSSMGPMGYLYVPSGCRSSGAGDATPCRLNVAFHGCKQTLSDIGQQFVLHSGLNELAEANNIVILYPQAVRSPDIPYNPQGCWDFWGYTGEDYACKLGLQIEAVANMVKRLAGSFE